MQSAPDILASIAARGSFARKDIVAVMVRWLERQLIADQYARLGQAGHSPERKILLSRVFVDVDSEAPDPSREPRPAVVAELLAAAPTPVAPSPRGEGRGHRECSHYLLVGGPGQGKSTVGQFLCQLHRATLLDARSEQLSAEGQHALQVLLQQRAEAELAVTEPLFPVRVELSRLANWLSEQQEDAALLSYLTTQVLRATGEVLAPEDLRAWLQAYPFLLVLDGLDEVPVSAGRAPLLQVIQSFRAQLGDAPGLLVAATRPQGYGDEFADFRVRRLAPLSQARALRYGERLVHGWFGQNDGDRDQVLERLHLAVENPATAHMMRSPLQVTIMAALLHKMGSPPKERWHLFERYYNVIYDREQDKAGAAPELRTHRPLIDAIHRRVGLLLQVESERSGTTDALLTRPRLREIIDTTLSVQKIRTGREALTERLLRLATDRLVFLVEPQDGRFGFEVRSLQEFMAAEALREGAEGDVKQRLLQIGKPALWRNVLSLVLSHAMHTLSHWREWLCDDLCQQLNEAPGDEAGQRVLAGSQLALDLLTEGAALHDQLCAEPLAKHALRLLEGPISRRHEQLAQLSAWQQEDLAQMLVTALEDALPRAPQPAGLGAWAVLIDLANRGVDWAIRLADQRWPTDGVTRRAIVDATQYPGWNYRIGPNQGPWLLATMAKDPETFGPEAWLHVHLRPFLRRPIRGQDDESAAILPDWLLAVAALLSGEPKAAVAIKDLAGEVLLSTKATYRSLSKVGDEWRALTPATPLPPHWRPWMLTWRFLLKPDASSLAEVLRCCAGLDAAVLNILQPVAPWPLALCLRSVSTPAELAQMAADAEAGLLGYADDWLAAEARWGRQGILAADWSASAERKGHLDASIRAKGIPGGLRVDNSADGRLKFIDGTLPLASYLALLSLHVNLPPGAVANDLAENLSRLSIDEDAADAGQVAKVQDLLKKSLPRWAWPSSLLTALNGEDDRVALVDSYDEAERQGIYHALFNANEDIILFVVDTYRNHPERTGLLHLLAVRRSIFHQERIWELPEQLLELERATSVEERLSLALLRLHQGLPVSPDIAFELVQPGRADWAPRFLGAIYGHKSPRFREAFYLSLLKHLPPSSLSLLVEATDALLNLVRSRPTELDLPHVWEALHLPPPPPQPPKDYSAPVQLRSLTIRNLRCFDELTIALPERSPGVGGWGVLVGENGVGKTTALRAAALAGLDPAMATAILAQMREQSRVPMLRRSHLPGEVLLQLRDSRLRVHLHRAEDHETVSPVEAGHARPLLYAYGCQRGSALGGPDRDLPLGPLADVNTLFEGREGLIHGETWLKNRRLAAYEQPNGRAKQIYDTILKVLLQLLPGVESIDVRDDRAWFSGTAVGEAPLGALSDGYISTAGWVLDLMARYLERAQQRGWTIAADFPARMEGLVLVDEVDQHLHPRWQVRILSDLRRIFPRLSFLVTTHNPLTLLGAEDGEVVVLRRSESGRIEAAQVDIPRGLRVDQVLTGSWFGLASTLHPAVLEELDRHRRMLRDGVAADDPERLALEQRLRQQLSSFAETSYERLAQSVAAEVVDERFPDQRPEERRSIREKIRQLVEERGGKLP